MTPPTTLPAPLPQPDPIRLGLLARSADPHLQALARAAHDDFPAWVDHVRPAASCTRPIRLHGTMTRIEAETGRLLSTLDTADLPDGVVYKACGNRRESVCPSCSARYKGDAYQLVRAGLVGGKGVPETVATHPAVFPTFTAPSFGPVHSREVKRHTCGKRKGCDCRPEPCHPRRDKPTCPHGVPLFCYARHEHTDKVLGSPLCPGCYDYPAQVVWNNQSGELWRRTTIAMTRHLRRVAKARGIGPRTFRLSFGKAAEMQRRAAVHFHAIVRLDGADPNQPGVILPPPTGLDAADLKDAVDHAVSTVAFHTLPHPITDQGWRIAWGEQVKTKIITVAGNGEVTDAMVAAYLAKYATKSTEVGVLGTRPSQGLARAVPVGAHARLRRPLLHQEPHLLDQLHHPAPGPHCVPPHRGHRPVHGDAVHGRTHGAGRQLPPIRRLRLAQHRRRDARQHLRSPSQRAPNPRPPTDPGPDRLSKNTVKQHLTPNPEGAPTP